MSEPADRESAERLERLRVEATRERARRKKERAQRALEPRRGKPRAPRGGRWAHPARLREAAWLGARLAGLAALPFVTLVGGSIWTYRLLGVPTWGALALAASLTAASLTFVALRLAKSILGRYRMRRIGMRMGMRIALPVVAIYSAYSLLYLARENAKSDDVRAYFTSVHPLLRIALGTALLADRSIVLTETARTAADYGRMGLPRREQSLHFRQPDGYVHAVDLRTAGRSWLRNAAMRAWFSLMGLRTLRHVGTADHLHVSLPP